MTPLQRKRRIRTTLSIVAFIFGACLIVGIIIVFFCYFLGVFPTPKFVRRLRVKQYSYDTAYSTITGKAQVRYYDDREIFITVTLDEVLTDNYGHYNTGSDYSYYFIVSQCKVMETNGFKDVLSQPVTDEYGSVYYTVTQPVTVTASNYIWGDGMRPFAVGLSIGDREYLSYETGKEKLLHYFLYEMH